MKTKHIVTFILMGLLAVTSMTIAIWRAQLGGEAISEDLVWLAGALALMALAGLIGWIWLR